jgi:hypothetical protein
MLELGDVHKHHHMLRGNKISPYVAWSWAQQVHGKAAGNPVQRTTKHAFHAGNRAGMQLCFTNFNSGAPPGDNRLALHLAESNP